MKKWLISLLLVLVLSVTAASATIIPPKGVDEDFYEATGIPCQPAVSLARSLSIMDERGDQGGKKVASLPYSGEDIPVIENWGRYAKIYYDNGEKTGWIINEYLIFDPAWYVFDKSAAVYAYPDWSAPCVGWMSEGTELPIIIEKRYNGQDWLCVSLRGAAGWVPKTDADQMSSAFSLGPLQNIDYAVLSVNGESRGINDWRVLSDLSDLLTNADVIGESLPGYHFDAVLSLELENGQEVELQIATDSVCVFRVDGKDYQYARHLNTPEDHPESTLLFDLFGLDAENDWEQYPGNG